MPDTYRAFDLPMTEFALTGSLGDQAYTETFIPLSNTVLLIAVQPLSSGGAQVIFQRYSTLTIADYLQSVGEDSQFLQISDLMRMTDLLDSMTDAEYTLFLPTNHALSDIIIPSDTDEISQFLSNHIFVDNLPPYVLPDHETLMSFAEDMISLEFDTTASGYWEIEGAPILWDIHLANGVIYGIDGVINPSE